MARAAADRQNSDSGYRFTFEPHSRRVRAEFSGATIADSTRTVVVRETRLPAVYYFPREDVRMDLFCQARVVLEK